MSRILCRSETLVEALRAQAAEKPDAEHLVMLDDTDAAEPMSFGELLEGAQAVARGLRSRGVEPGQTVALMLPTGREFFTSFMGVLVADAVPVPVYPPVRLDQIEEYAKRQVGILRNAEVRALITLREAQSLAALLRPKVPSLGVIVRADELEAAGRHQPAGHEAAVAPGDLALIQYTSGSTGDPKGVTLTHRNVVANVRSIGEAVEVDDRDVVVSWLPLYHDMGLIGCWLFALCHGLRMVSFSPLAFLRKPRRWLQAMNDYRGSLSPAPNFAYELCLRRIRDRDIEGIDLSSWRVALNGAEPVGPATIERFCERFGAHGFPPRAMTPVYGLAEAAVALTFSSQQRPLRIDRVARETFQREGRAEPLDAASDASEAEALRFVSVGGPIPGNEIRLVDDDGAQVAERVAGNIQFRGPSATPGYFHNPKATAALRTADGWTKTGDLGYLADGNLFITGRVKDVIIKAGRNIDPAEVEAVAAEVDGIRRGCVAAFGVSGSRMGSEQLVIVAETRTKDPEVRGKLVAEVRRRVAAVIQVAPDTVELVVPHVVPKTPSGKLRRAECRRRFETGTLAPRRLPVWVQVARLAGAAGWVYLVARLWRRRSRRDRDSTEAGKDGVDPPSEAAG